MEVDHVEPGAVADPPAPRQGSSLWSGVAQVGMAWLFARLIVTVGSPIGWFSFRPQDWYHWDAFNYLAITTSGRTFGACGSPGIPAAFIAGTKWCGTAGWLPGFPIATKMATAVGLSATDASVVLPSVFLLATLVVVWFGWTRAVSPWRSLVVLLLIGVFPGAVYNFAPYPTSLALLGIVVAAWAAARNHPVVVALALAVAVVSYSTAIFAAVGLITAMVLVRWGDGPWAMVRRAAWGALGFCSLAAMAIHDQVVFHHWNAYSLIQNESNKSFDFPGVQTFDLIVRRTTRTQRFIGHTGAWIMSAQAILAIALIVGACAIGFTMWWRHGRAPLDLYPAAIGVATLLFMVSSGTGSIWHRGVVLAAPSAIAYRHLPAWITALLVACTAVVTALLSAYFFKNTLG